MSVPGSGTPDILARRGGAPVGSRGRVGPSDLSAPPGASTLGPMLAAIRDDLGFETASLFVRSGGEWQLLERSGPVRDWHAVLDPSLFEGFPEADECEDVRSIPGVGRRLAAMGCVSIATLPVPDGGRLLLDAGCPVAGGGWIARARPYLDLMGIMAGPAWPVEGAIRGHDEVAALQRVFTECQRALAWPGAMASDLLRPVREALGAQEIYLLTADGDDDLEVSADPPRPWLGRVSRDALPFPASRDEGWPEFDQRSAPGIAMELSASSRALAGAFGRSEGAIEILLAGWAHGPALSPVSMSVAARAVSTARAALNARTQAVTSIVDKQRTRMAFALHDGLTQAVTGAVLELEALHKAIERDPTEAIEIVDHSKTEIRRALAELRSILFDLSQTQEHERTPAEPLTRYVEDVVRRWRLPARVAVQGDLSRVPSRVLSVAYIVIREALANAAKHAAARNVTVRLAAGERDLVVTVGDSGPGFTPRDEEAAREGHHVGLDLLRRRVREAGGQLRVESHPGQGTRVIARLPIEGAES